MHKKKVTNSAEQWGMEVFGDILTKGKFDIIKNVWHLVIKVTASIPLVFLRYRTGARFISSATLFCGYLIMTACWMIEQTYRAEVIISTGEAPEGEPSLALFVLAIIAFGLIGGYRVIESRRNLRRSDGKGKPRYGHDSGLSIFWIFFLRVAEPCGLATSKTLRDHWWQINEYYFQKFVEPLFIAVVGCCFHSWSYGAFGTAILFSAFSAFMLVVHLEDNYFNMKQESWDAQVLSGVIQHRDEPITRHEGVVIQQTVVRSDQEGFEQWKKQAKERSLSIESHRKPAA